MLPELDRRRSSSSRPDAQSRCAQCKNGNALGFDFSYAYQPIVDIDTRQIFAHEALVRGTAGESAYSVLSLVTGENRYAFDQACRVKAIEIASRVQLDSYLSINFLPNAVYRPEVCIRTTLEAAKQHGWPVNRIIFETVEGERVDDGKWFAEVLREYQRIGFLTAIDDFGAGYAGLNLLADFLPDIVKLDMALVRNIETRRSAQSIVRCMVGLCAELGVRVVAEGIETLGEYHCLDDLGVRLMQGYLFARPTFEAGLTADRIPWPDRTGQSDQARSHRAPASVDDVYGGAAIR